MFNMNVKGVNKMNLSQEMKQALRVKRARLDISKNEAAELLGINRLTYGQLESDRYNNNLHKGTFQKVAEWLAQETN